MSIQTATNRFILPPKVKSAGLYQELLTGVLNYEQLANRLVMLSEQARALRKFETLSEYAFMLSNLPVEKFQLIGQYYSALSLCRSGQGELEKAKSILEKVASIAPSRYRAEAMVSLSSISQLEERPEETLKYCLEASKVGKFSVATIKALRGIAVLKSREGFHHSSLRDLENLYPIMKYTPANIYFDYLNSLAVELAEVGRLEEARNISNIVLASPYVFAYPEWRETREDIERKGYSSRSAVYIGLKSTQQNVLLLPLSDSQKTYARNPFQPPAIVQRIDEWKKMPKKKNGDKKDDYELPANPTQRDIFFRIMHLASQDGLSEKTLWKILDAVERIVDESEE